MKVLITGASGFIGRNLVKRFQSIEGVSSVKAIVRRNEKSTVHEKVSFCEIPSIDAGTNWMELLNNVDIVIHVAARAHVLKDNVADPLKEYRKINVEGTLRLARCCAVANVKRFIFISSIGVCGLSTSFEVFTEATEPSPVADYAISKLEAENGLRRISEDTGMDAVIIRPPLVYAADAPGNFRKLLGLSYKGFPLPLGSLKNKRSFIALENLVDFICHCSMHKNAKNQTFLVSDGYDFSTPELMKLISYGMGKKCVLFPFPLSLLRLLAKLLGKGETFNQLTSSLQVDIKKATTLLGWVPPLDPKVAVINAGAGYASCRKSA